MVHNGGRAATAGACTAALFEPINEKNPLTLLFFLRHEDRSHVYTNVFLGFIIFM